MLKPVLPGVRPVSVSVYTPTMKGCCRAAGQRLDTDIDTLRCY